VPKIVELKIVKQDREASVEAAWQRFVAADRKAKETLIFADGVAARRAYREFLELFGGKP
jgi:hypothetical protein